MVLESSSGDNVLRIENDSNITRMLLFRCYSFKNLVERDSQNDDDAFPHSWGLDLSGVDPYAR